MKRYTVGRLITELLIALVSPAIAFYGLLRLRRRRKRLAGRGLSPLFVAFMVVTFLIYLLLCTVFFFFEVTGLSGKWIA